MAILLTYLTTRCDVDDLIKIFPSVQCVMKRTLRRAQIYMLRAMDSFLPARVVYPTREEALACYAMLTAAYGPCPVELRGPLWGYLDGMSLSVLGCGIEEVDDRFAAGMQGKGTCINNILLFAATGLICDGSVGWPGCYHDSRASESLFKRLHDPHYNSNATDGCVATDVGFIGHTCDAVLRPLHPTDQPSSPAQRQLWETVSAYLTVIRQGNERGNGFVRGTARGRRKRGAREHARAWGVRECAHSAVRWGQGGHLPLHTYPHSTDPHPSCSQFQRAFPRVLVPRSVHFHDDIVADVKLCVHLHNARTRLMGFNQLTTSYVGLVDGRFNELLACKGVEEYAAKAAAIVEKEGQLF